MNTEATSQAMKLVNCHKSEIQLHEKNLKFSKPDGIYIEKSVH